MTDFSRIHFGLAIDPNDVHSLIAHGWIVREPYPEVDVIKVRFTRKGRAEIVVFEQDDGREDAEIGFRNRQGRRWVVGTIRRSAAQPATMKLLHSSALVAAFAHRCRQRKDRPRFCDVSSVMWCGVSWLCGQRGSYAPSPAGPLATWRVPTGGASIAHGLGSRALH